MALSMASLDHSVAIILVIGMFPHAFLRSGFVCVNTIAQDSVAQHIMRAEGRWAPMRAVS